MKSTSTSPLSTRLDLRLAAYAAAGVAVATAATAPSARADVVSVTGLNLSVPNNIDGIYLNLVTGVSGTSGSTVTGYDFNPYGSGGFSTYFSGTATTGNAGLLNAAGNYAVLLPGSTVSSAGTYGTGSTATRELLYRAGQPDAYFGIHFLNEATGAVNYGYVELSTTATTGFPATILSYGYDNTGKDIVIPGAIPEPGTTAALSLGALSLGAAGVRRWRKNKQAVA